MTSPALDASDDSDRNGVAAHEVVPSPAGAPEAVSATASGSSQGPEAHTLNGDGAKEKAKSRSSSDETAADDEDEDEDEASDAEVEEANDAMMEENALKPTTSNAKEIWKFRMRPADDEEPEDWWFASTAIPLLAATTGPLANVLSIAALVVYWRETYDPDYPGEDDQAISFRDPDWCTALNAASLVCGVVGNLFLLFNFTRFVRYIVALPMTIVMWFLSGGILISIVTSMHIYTPPIWPDQIYSQGFWHAIFAAVLYILTAMLLMVNMVGYALGHYTQHFELTNEQRNLILQTMMFFFWLAGGAAVFSRTAGWNYDDALYFCDVTVLTIGFGDFASPNDLSRGMIFPYTIGGVIMLGLMVSSIRRFAQQLGHDKIVRNHVERRRQRTMSRSITSSFEAERHLAAERSLARGADGRPTVPISAPFDPQQRTITFNEPTTERLQSEESNPPKRRTRKRGPSISSIAKPMAWASNRMNDPPSKGLETVRSRNGRLLILREEKDRFLAMRAIQHSTRRFKKYSALFMSTIAFGLLWAVGALIFWQSEQGSEDITYFQALYFCWVSLLTIGYGDFAPKANLSKAFFVIWSLLAVPTMTILISDMGDTVVESYKRGTVSLFRWTVMPEKGFAREWVARHPRLFVLARKIQIKAEERAARRRLEQGFPVGPELETEIAEEAAEEGVDAGPGAAPTLDQLADEEIDEHDLARRLTLAIRRTADHMKEDRERHYTYEEWVEYTRLIRFSDTGRDADDDDEDDARGLVHWDWIGPKSPMMSDQSEAEWVLDRLCESLDRYMRKQLPAHVRQRQRDAEAEVRRRRSVPFAATAAATAADDEEQQEAARTAPDRPRLSLLDASRAVMRKEQRQRRKKQGAGSNLGGGLGLLAEIERREQEERLSLELMAQEPANRRRSSVSGASNFRRRSSSAVADNPEVPSSAVRMLARWRERVSSAARPSTSGTAEAETAVAGEAHETDAAAAGLSGEKDAEK